MLGVDSRGSLSLGELGNQPPERIRPQFSDPRQRCSDLKITEKETWKHQRLDWPNLSKINNTQPDSAPRSTRVLNLQCTQTAVCHPYFYPARNTIGTIERRPTISYLIDPPTSPSVERGGLHASSLLPAKPRSKALLPASLASPAIHRNHEINDNR